MYETPIDQFLVTYYTQFGNKLRRAIELNEIINKSSDNMKELYEIKNTLIESLDYMSYINKDEGLYRLFKTLSTLIVSNETPNLQLAMDFCNRMRNSQ